MTNVIENKYQLVKKLGEGCFGNIYSGFNKNTGEKIAVKISKTDSSVLLKNEARMYNYLNDIVGLPVMRSFGCIGNYNYLVLDLLGNSLEYYKEYCGGKLTLKTVLMIGMKMLERIKIIHNKGILHRDIKPDNFLMGRDENNKLYLIDFGLAKQYIDAKRNHIKKMEGKHLLGTPEFVSVNIHAGITPSRRDDLESIGYVLIYLLRGSLPWQENNIDDRDELYQHIREIKTLKNLWLMFDDVPGELIIFIKYCRNLSFTQDPDYNYLKVLLMNLYKLHGFPVDNKYDWMENEYQELPQVNE